MHWRPQTDTFLAAVDAGISAGQLAFCFAGGYQAALRALVPSLPPDAFGALLVTEGKLQRPEQIATTVMPQTDGHYRLDGSKSWVAGGSQATHLLVYARADTDGPAGIQSVLLVLPSNTKGVTLETRPATGFLDAVPHARATFSGVDVRVDQLLPGDGWREYVRPFRTREDIHVSVAIAAYLALHALRHDWPLPLRASLFAVLDRLAQCAQGNPTDPVVHVLLAGAEQELSAAGVQITELLKAAAIDDAFAEDWRRNGMLLALAAPVRAKRLEKALAALQ